MIFHRLGTSEGFLMSFIELEECSPSMRLATSTSLFNEGTINVVGRVYAKVEWEQ